MGKKEDRRLFTMLPSQSSASLARLLGTLKRLGEPLERKLVGTAGTTCGSALHGQIGTFAHGVEHAGLLRHVLDPGTILLGVHRELRGTDLSRRFGAFLERIADDDRYLIAHVFGG